MAEFPHLGQQCSQCKTLDFLPLVCIYCKSVFCKEHHSVVVHNCSSYEKTSALNATNSCDLKSILGKCCFCLQLVPDTELVLCDKCNDNHCLSHRHYESHDCKRNKSNDKPKQTVPNPVFNASAPNIRGTKNEGLARKVMLMKLKQTASGVSSIPMTERVYLKIKYQKSSQQNLFESKDVFVDKEWSIGKCIDWLSTHLSLINRNNNPLAPKLVLSTDCEDSQPFSLSASLKQLESEGLVQNGDNLCLKYIE